MSAKWLCLLLASLPLSAQNSENAPQAAVNAPQPTGNAVAPPPANTPPPSPGPSAIERQQNSIQKQLGAVTRQNATPSSWFSTPWPASTGAAAIPSPTGSPTPISTPGVVAGWAQADCDPLDPEKLTNLVRGASTRENVKEDLLRAVISQESGARPCAVSPKGAKGLMQLMPATAQDLGVTDPLDPEQNVNAGARLLKQLMDKYKGDVKLALSAYNAGSGTVDRAGGVPNIPETKNYLISILQKLVY